MLQEYVQAGQWPSKNKPTTAEVLAKKAIIYTQNYCRICGRTPGRNEEPNYAPIRFWDADDGWIIGTLCRWCFYEVKDDKPQEDDYAYHFADDFCDELSTDEDPIGVL